jgi:hypothetical protein
MFQTVSLSSTGSRAALGLKVPLPMKERPVEENTGYVVYIK